MSSKDDLLLIQCYYRRKHKFCNNSSVLTKGQIRSQIEYEDKLQWTELWICHQLNWTPYLPPCYQTCKLQPIIIPDFLRRELHVSSLSKPVKTSFSEVAEADNGDENWLSKFSTKIVELLVPINSADWEDFKSFVIGSFLTRRGVRFLFAVSQYLVSSSTPILSIQLLTWSSSFENNPVCCRSFSRSNIPKPHWHTSLFLGNPIGSFPNACLFINFRSPVIHKQAFVPSMFVSEA